MTLPARPAPDQPRRCPTHHGPALLLSALLAALLPGCASGPAPDQASGAPPTVETDRQRQAAFDQSQQRWHGASVQELLAKQGQPSSRGRDAQGILWLSYTRTARLKGPAGPLSFSCTVHYQVDAKRSRIVGHRIEGC